MSEYMNNLPSPIHVFGECSYHQGHIVKR